MTEFHSGNYLAVDVGMARIGVARAVAGTTLALPVTTLKVQADGSEFEELIDLVTQTNPAAVFVGLPKLMSGKEGQASKMARSYARRLARRIQPLEVRLIDERLSSSTAHDLLRQAGVSTRNHKAMVDQMAAVQILTRALETSSQAGILSGELVMID